MNMTKQALFLALLGVACAPAQKVSSGAATTAVARVALESDLGDITVRPSEVHWAVSGELAYAATVRAYELEGGTLGGALFYGGPDADQILPPVVQFAAARAVEQGKADGALVTHYLVKEIIEPAGTTYEVQLAGRLLQLTDLGSLDGERTDEVDGLRLRYELARERLIEKSR